MIIKQKTGFAECVKNCLRIIKQTNNSIENITSNRFIKNFSCSLSKSRFVDELSSRDISQEFFIKNFEIPEGFYKLVSEIFGLCHFSMNPTRILD